MTPEKCERVGAVLVAMVVVGMLVLLLGYYYARAARRELTSFFRWTVHARSAVLLFFLAFVVLGFAPPILIVFGAIDAPVSNGAGDLAINVPAATAVIYYASP